MIYDILYGVGALLAFRPLASYVAHIDCGLGSDPAWGLGILAASLLVSIWPLLMVFFVLNWFLQHSEFLAVGAERKRVTRRRMLDAEQQARELARTVRDYEAGRI